MCIFWGILVNVLMKKNNGNTTTVSVNTVRDISAEAKSADTADNLYQREADALWEKYSSQFYCDAEKFKSEFTRFRENGLTRADAFNEVDLEYGKVGESIDSTTENSIDETAEADTILKKVPTSEQSGINTSGDDNDLTNFDENEYTATESVDTPTEDSEPYYYKELNIE